MIKPHLWSKGTGFSLCQIYWALKTGIIFQSYIDLLDYLEHENI